MHLHRGPIPPLSSSFFINVTRSGKRYVFAQKFEIALWVSLESVLHGRYDDANPSVRSGFLSRVIDGSVVAAGYASFLDIAR